MNSFYGFNVHSQGLKNPTALIEHTIKVKPRWGLVMDGLPLLQQLQVASASTHFIHRNYAITNGDDDVFKRLSPKHWLEAHAEDIRAGVWMTTTCEPGWSQDVIDWHIELMRLSIPAASKLVIGNWSVGTPDPGVIGMAKYMLQLCADHPELFVLGLHEYAGAVITSGFVGGAPDGWTQSHDKQYHPDYQKEAAWPLDGEAKTLTHWHCGRFQFWTNYCKSVGIKPPRIVLTEVGFDDVSDIGWWTASLPRTEPYKDIAGFKTLQAYWKRVFPQWSHDMAYFKQLEYAEKNIYADTTVEGACIYNYGHKDAKWEPDDIEGRTEFLGYLEASAQAKELNMTTISVPKKDIVFGQSYRVRKSGDVIRAYLLPKDNDPGVNYKTIPSNAIVTVLSKTTTNGRTWYGILYKNFTGIHYIQGELLDDISATATMAVVNVDESPTPPQPPPAIPVTPAPTSLPEKAETPPTPVVMANPSSAKNAQDAITEQLKIAHCAMGKVIDLMSGTDTRETIADIQHGIWSSWMQWVFKICPTNDDGSVTIPSASVERWKRQIATPYADLTEKEKDSDREQADKVLTGIA